MSMDGIVVVFIIFIGISIVFTYSLGIYLIVAIIRDYLSGGKNMNWKHFPNVRKRKEIKNGSIHKYDF